MESHAVAEVAHERGIPFLGIRAIADPAGRRLPTWLGGVIGEAGRPRLRMLVKGLAAHPGDVADLVRLAVDARRGMATLRRVAAGAGPLLAFTV
jgi:adenosylhomocysteine nucleosidase